MPIGKCLNSKNSRRAYRRMLKNKWRKEINRQFNEEINEFIDKRKLNIVNLYIVYFAFLSVLAFF